MKIISHRGISENSKLKENSLSSIVYQINQGFDLELDIRFTKDKRIILSHDNIIFDNHNSLLINDHDFQSLNEKIGDLTSFSDLLELIKKYPLTNFFIHIKKEEQSIENLNALFQNIVILKNLFFFDLTPSSAKYIFYNFPGFNIGASFSPLYDKIRFNNGTLLYLHEVLLNAKYYNFIWYDQWDTKFLLGNKPYCNYLYLTFFKWLNFKIALIGPDLHSFNVNYAKFFKTYSSKIDFFCTNNPLKIQNLKKYYEK